MEEKSKGSFAYLAIVAIVAIVALVVLIKGSSSTGQQYHTFPIIGSDIAGQPIKDPSSVKKDICTNCVNTCKKDTSEENLVVCAEKCSISCQNFTSGLWEEIKELFKCLIRNYGDYWAQKACYDAVAEAI
ncbi:hypothetical protein JW968_03615 [Candidatus Woesearchaeota archaeon]|nr:hypothetical protein [Candidatus Woesearchaeota archaeon]